MAMKKCCCVHTLPVGISLLALLLVSGAGAMTITVNVSGDRDYTRIQDAIDNASSGDTILVYRGIYHENVNVNKQLILRGIGNPVVVNAGGHRSVITIAANGITLEGFTATGSYSSKNAGIKVTSNNNTLIGNNASKNRYGIYMSSSSNNTLNGNNASNNRLSGIHLSSSNNNTLSGNNALNNNWNGITMEYSSYNKMRENNASNNQGRGISLSSSGINTLSGNNASNNDIGISLYGSSNTILTSNNASNNNNGIYLEFSSNNTLSDNLMTENKRNFNLDGGTESNFDNHIDKSNLVDGKPIYYIIKVSDTTYDSSSNAGTFYCISCVNVTIKNLTLNKNGKGIYFWNTSQSRIQNVNASKNGDGISMSYSSNNTLTGNAVFSNSVFGGISLFSSSNNILTDNNVSSNNGYCGIYLSHSSNNTLGGNNVSLNNRNVYGYFGYGIYLSSSSNNTLSDNLMSGNQENFNLDVETESDFDNHIDKSNLVDGKPIYYLIKASDTTYDYSSNAGTFYCISCVNVTIKNLNFNKNGKGIYFWNTSKSKIQNVTASYNWEGISLSLSSNNTLRGNNASKNYGSGISLESSSNNTLTGNNASNNGHYGAGMYFGISLYFSSNITLNGNNISDNGGGIYLGDSSNNNIYNNIFNNTNNVEFEPGINVWNTTSKSGINIIGGSLLGGNFWANPEGTGFSQTCLDANEDGICDKNYILDAKNIDYLPLSMNFTKDNIPPKSVSKLKNLSYASSYINWTWKDPKDIDFKKVIVFIDSKFKRNVSKGKRYYNATNFEPNTRHTISTRTVDMNGNINKTWTNHSAWTAK